MAGKKAAEKQLKRMADYLEQIMLQNEPTQITLVTRPPLSETVDAIERWPEDVTAEEAGNPPYTGDARFHMPGDGHPSTDPGAMQCRTCGSYNRKLRRGVGPDEHGDVKACTDTWHAPEPAPQIVSAPSIAGESCGPECSEHHTFNPPCVLSAKAREPQKMHDIRVMGYEQRPGVQMRCNPCAWARHFNNPTVEDLVLAENSHFEGEDA